MSDFQLYQYCTKIIWTKRNYLKNYWVYPLIFQLSALEAAIVSTVLQGQELASSSEQFECLLRSQFLNNSTLTVNYIVVYMVV